MERNDTKQVVITGFGAVTPVGNDRESTWQNLVAGNSGVGPIRAFDASDLAVRIAAEVRDFDAGRYLDRRRLRRTARFSQFAVAAAREAVADAGLEIGDGSTVDASDVGVVINAAVAGFDTIEAAARRLAGGQPLSPYFVPSSLANMPACEVSIDLGIHGPVHAGAYACASGSEALLRARQLILSGEARVVIAGGTDAGITPVTFGGLIPTGALSRRNDDPAGACRPFDADRDGFVYGEGAVIAVVESAEHAAARGATPYAALAAGALTADAFHVTAPAPGGEYAAEAIRLAVARAGVDASDIDYICAHATGTAAGDRAEALAIRQALGPAADHAAVSSPKSVTGHLIGAAGALSALVCALAMRDGIVPPTINLKTPDPECDLDHVANVARQLPVRTAITNAFGFGGQNCVAVLTAV
ncbi:beta-ketoacyl-ACP synthase II [Trebonia sp.]|uniref:beta-ketoacyl-[acyl-carrier-protein] synthase family protein n=1 Tax=Trebonia sp. TaxID=2767075 RepID=UPI00260C3AD3|nr:beta-ketoacyl-ACP synthase II [Trebonia sp.]